MTALGSVGRTPHRTIFDPTPGSGTDPSKFSLNPGHSIPPFQDSFRVPYLSPPMSGSPSPESRPGPLRGTRRRRRSSSPSTPTTAVPTTEPDDRPGANNSISSINLVLNHETTHPPNSQGALSATANSAATGIPTPEDPGLGASSIQPGTVPLPPRLTRRTKAHVASACVNCKQKHLGCDSARPCRRCVLAGKEASCVDVVHKRRGRPPLKAEEGPLRTSESFFVHQDPSRAQLQAQSTSRPHTSVSRQIRPMTNVPLSSHLDISYSMPESRRNSAFTINAPLELAPMLSPPSTMPAVSPASSFSGYRHSTAGVFPERQDTRMLGADVGPHELTRRLSDSSPYLGRRHAAEGFPASQPPNSYYRQLPRPSASTTDAALQTSRAQSAGSGQPGSGVTLPSISEFQLPPIFPSRSDDEGRPHFRTPTLPPQPQPPPPQSYTPPARPSRDQKLQSESVGKLEKISSRQPQPNPQDSPPTPSEKKRMSHPQLETAYFSSPPRRETETQAVAAFDFTTDSSPRPSVSARTQKKDDEKVEDGLRPKRRKMELGEMVNE